MCVFVFRSGVSFRSCAGFCTIRIDMYGDYDPSGVSGATPVERRGPTPPFWWWVSIETVISTQNYIQFPLLGQKAMLLLVFLKDSWISSMELCGIIVLSIDNP